MIYIKKKIILFILSFFTTINLLYPKIFAKYVMENSLIAAELNIDITKPYATVSYSITDQTQDNVIVSIVLSEPVQDVLGWSTSEDGLTLSKVYEQNSNEIITITDLSENINTVEINVQNINK